MRSQSVSESDQIRHPELIIPYNTLSEKRFLSPFQLLLAIASACQRFYGSKCKRVFCRFISNVSCVDIAVLDRRKKDRTGFCLGRYRQEVLFLLAGIVCMDTHAQQAPSSWIYAACNISTFSPGSATLYNFNPSAPSGTVYGSINTSLSGECHSTPGPFTNVKYSGSRSEPMIYSGTALSNFNESHLYVRVFYSGSAGGWSGYSSNSSGFPNQTIVDWKADNNTPTTGFNHSYSSSLTVQLIKRGNGVIPNLTAGSQISFRLNAKTRTYMSLHADYWLDGVQGWRSDALWWSPDKPAIFTFSLASVMPPPTPTCTTPNIPVQTMLPVSVSSFNGLGIGQSLSVNRKNFTLPFINCSNQSQIRYMVNAIGTSPNPSQGILPVSPDLGGVALQLRDQPNNALQVTPLGSWRIINTSASNYNLHMQVSYYRSTGAVIVPGDFTAAMTITTQYQ